MIGAILLRKIKLQIQILDTALSLKADAIKCFAPEVTFANYSLFFCPQIYLISLFSCHDTGAMVESGCDQLLSPCYSQITRLIPESESGFSVTVTFSNVVLQSQGSDLITE